MRAELQAVLQSLPGIPAEELPRLMGEIEEIRATAMMRMTTPAPPKNEDRLIGIDEAAERLGMSKDYLYRHADEFPFTRRNGRSLRFSSLGIDKHLKDDRRAR